MATRINDELNELRRELTAERVRSRALEEDNRRLRNELVKLQALAEQEDEARVIRLSKHLAQLKKEKEDLLVLVEQEEEYITNTLVKKLEQVRKEKIDLENQLEQEQEFITNKLQKQLAIVVNDKLNLEKKLEDETSEHERLEKLEHELAEIRGTLKQFESERDQYQGKNDALKDELLKLKTENFVLSQRIKREQEKLSQVSNEKLQLAKEVEIGDERRYNVRGRIKTRTRSSSLPPSYFKSHPLPQPQSSIPPSTPAGVTGRPRNSSTSPLPISGITSPSLASPSRLSVGSSPRQRQSQGKVLKSGLLRVKVKSNEQVVDQWDYSSAVLLSSGALHIWRNGADDQSQHPPSLILDMDTVSRLAKVTDSGTPGLELTLPSGTVQLTFDISDKLRDEWYDLIQELCPVLDNK
jgi:hypothetical protein